MAKSIKLRQGTEAEHAAFTGAMAEVTFDTTNNRIILHDGTTPGGIPMAKLSDVPVDLTDLTDVDDNLPSGTGGAAVFSGTTYVVTVASGTNTYGTGNKYYIDGFLDASPTVTLTEGETYRFDQSDSTNAGHPLKFSTTANGTHDSGSAVQDNITVCAIAGEGETLSITAPDGYTFSSVDFASYGNPTGECENFAQGGCHSTSSQTVVEGYLLGNTGTINIPVDNSVFGDPCFGTSKRLYIQTTVTGLASNSDSEYTTGVTYNGVPGQANAYTEITVEVGAPTLYYYCQNHSGMGSVGAAPAAPAENSLVLNSSNTTLLVTATGTSDNNNITDSSTNNHSITVNGDVMAGTFSPYRSGGYSLEFNGSNSAVGIQSSDVYIGTSAFSMEFWLYSRAHSSLISSKYSSSNSNGYFVINTSTSDGLTCRTRVDGYDGAQKYVHSGSGTYNLNQWNHCIFQRDANGNLTSYLNGTKYTGDNDGSTNLSATELALGVFNYIGFATWFDGYIRDFKLTIGTSALRTDSNITVPTEPLTSDSNTTAFLGHSPYLIDGSTNSNSIVSTNAIISPFSPYDYLGYAAADHGGSVYFDGTGDYITVDDGFHFGTDDFTFEFWLYPTENLGAQQFINAETSGSGVTWSFGCSSYGGYNGLTFSYGNYGSYTVGRYVNNYWPTQNTWTHLAVQRRNGIIEIFVNGTSQTLTTYNENGTFSDGANLTSNYTSRYFFNDLEGYVSDLKVIKGQAIYTSNFTSPTAPLSSSDSSLHIKGTDASIIDKSQSSNNLTLFGNTTGSTTQVKFADTKSMYFDGSGDYIQSSLTEDNLPNEFTIEGWVNTSTVSGPKGIFGIDNTAFPSTSAGIALFTRSSTYNHDYAFYCNGIQVNSTTPPTANSWQHFAIVRNSSNLVSLYLDGISIASDTISGTVNGSILTIGGYYSSSYLWNGYIQDFRITKGLARYTANFTPPTQSLGSYVVPAEVPAAPAENSLVLNSSNTTLLVTATGTSDNNNITDSSTNNHSITVNGDVMAGTFSPYRSGGYSTYFDGSGDKLKLGGSALSDFNFGTNSFSIEFWMYPTGAKGPIFNTHRVGVANGYYLSLTGNNQFIFGQYVSGGGDVFSTDNAYALNEWNHVSLNRDANNGNSLKLYVNGSLVLTTTNSTNYNSYTYGPYIGGYDAGGTQYFFGGYISDLIVTNGSVLRTGGTSLSDVAFTPPTEAFESDANTALLISSSLPYIKDSSSNSHDITVTGDVSTMPFAPYDYSEYDPSIHGGSVHFDGSGDYLTVNDTNIANFGTNDFTIETWIYRNNTERLRLVDTRPTNTTGAYVTLGIHADGGVELYSDGNNLMGGLVGTINVGQWHHVAWVRNSGTVNIYIDGTSVGSVSNSTNFISGNFAIGLNSYAGEWPGSFKISDFNITKDFARYTANFTPPTAPLSSSDSSLHIKGTDASILDKSQSSNDLTLFGNTTGSTTQVKFAGTKSMYFDGTGYVRVEDLGIGPLVTNEGFTIETWVYPTTALSSGNRAIFGLNKISNGDNVIVFTGMEGGAIYYAHADYWTTSTNIPENEWSHVAVVVVGTSLKTYLNGSEVMSQTYSGLSTINWDDLILAIGGEFDSGGGGGIGNRIEGYIQDFRITKGLARYTENFTPPTKSLGSNVVPAETAAEVPAAGPAPMWSLSGDSATFAAVTTAKLDTNATNYVALHHPTGWGNSWGLEDGSYALLNNPNALDGPSPNRSVHVWSTDDLSEGMTYQYYIKFRTAQPTMWEGMTGITAGSSASYSYSQWLIAGTSYPHTLGWGSNGEFQYYTHSANGNTRLDTQGWIHFAIELQSNGRIVHYINGEVVVNEDASDISGLTNKANARFDTVNSWMTDIEVYTGGGIHNPDLLETPPGFTPPARKLA